MATIVAIVLRILIKDDTTYMLSTIPVAIALFIIERTLRGKDEQ